MKQVKKEKFIRIFLLRFVVLLVVFLAVCFGVTSICHYQYKTSKDLEMETWVEEVKYDTYQKYTGLKSEGKEGTELMDTFTRNLQWSVDTDCPTFLGLEMHETAALSIYNADTKELYAKSDKNVYMILKEYKGYGGCFRYDGNHFEEFDDIYQRLSAFEEKEMLEPIPYLDEYYEVVMDGIYVTKENTFTPKNIRLVRFSSQTKEELETLVSYNMEPEDPSGYTYFTMEELPDIKLTRPLMVGFDTSDKQTREAMDAFLEGKTKWQVDLDSILEMECDAVWGSSGEGIRIETSWLYVDDTPLQVVAVCTYDFWGLYKKGLIRFYLILFILCMVIASLWSLYRYKMNKGYYELDQYRKQTTNILAHDLKTPLTAIMGYTENLQQDTHPEKKTYYLDSILSNVGYMNEIIEMVLALGKVEDVGYKISREEISLSECIHEVMEKYELLMNEKGLQIEVDGTAVIDSDTLLVRQLLDNLIGNAVKYSLNGTVIDIEILEKKISITNQMEEALEVEPDELLQPFVKGDASRGGSTGSGLGLTIVNHIVKLLNYKMKVSVDGNTFTVEIEL